MKLSAKRKIEWLLFATTFFAYSYFFQGGGWAQNARFAMVRAIVEENHCWIDNYLIYARTSNAKLLARVPVRNATFEAGGSTYALTWAGTDGRYKLIDDQVDPRMERVPMETVGVTGDFAYARGHFNPSKAPGTSLLARLPYSVLYYSERLFGVNPDGWWTLTVNAWLTTAFSVGLISAFGCVLVFRLAYAFSMGKLLPSMATAVVFAFGTMFFPLATLFQDQNIATSLLLTSFYLLYRAKETGMNSGLTNQKSGGRLAWRIALSGLCAGYAAVTNYVAAAAVIALGIYLVWSVRRIDGWKWFAAGVAVPLLILCAYNLACFGMAFMSNYHYEHVAMSRGGEKGMLVMPRLDVMLTILFSPFRGLFFSAPVLLMSVYGLWRLSRNSQWKWEAGLFVVFFCVYLLFNASWWVWHGSWIAVPRHLGPAVPFLAAPMVFGFMRWPKVSCALALVSIAANLLFTAVDPEVPTTFDSELSAPTWPQWRHPPLFEYTLPIFMTGRAGPFLDYQLEKMTREYAAELDATGVTLEQKGRLLATKRQEWDIKIKERRMPGSNGPVSSNPTGIYECWFYSLFPSASKQAEWNSFNAGEFIWPGSRLSLLPLALVCWCLLFYAFRVGVRADHALAT